MNSDDNLNSEDADLSLKQSENQKVCARASFILAKVQILSRFFMMRTQQMRIGVTDCINFGSLTEMHGFQKIYEQSTNERRFITRMHKRPTMLKMEIYLGMKVDDYT